MNSFRPPPLYRMSGPAPSGPGPPLTPLWGGGSGVAPQQPPVVPVAAASVGFGGGGGAGSEAPDTPGVIPASVLMQVGRDKRGLRYGPEAYAPLLVVGVLGRRGLSPGWLKGWARRHVLGEGRVLDADIVDVDAVAGVSAQSAGSAAPTRTTDRHHEVDMREMSATGPPVRIDQLFCRGRHVLVLCAETVGDVNSELEAHNDLARRAAQVADLRNMLFMFTVCHELVIARDVDSVSRGILDVSWLRQLRVLDVTRRVAGSFIVSVLNEALAPHPDVKITALVPGKVVPRLTIAVSRSDPIPARDLLLLESDARVLLPAYETPAPFKPSGSVEATGPYSLFQVPPIGSEARLVHALSIGGSTASDRDPLGIRSNRASAGGVSLLESFLGIDAGLRVGDAKLTSEMPFHASQRDVLPVLSVAKKTYSPPHPGSERGSRFSASPLPATKAWCLVADALARLFFGPDGAEGSDKGLANTHALITERLKISSDPDYSLSLQRCNAALAPARTAMTTVFRQIQRELPKSGKKSHAHTHSATCVCVNGARDAWRTVEREFAIAGATGPALTSAKQKLFREWRTQWTEPVVQLVDFPSLPVDPAETPKGKGRIPYEDRIRGRALKRCCPCGTQRGDISGDTEAAVRTGAMLACKSCTDDEFVWLTDEERQRGWHIALTPVTRETVGLLSADGSPALFDSQLDFECAFGHRQVLPGPGETGDRSTPMFRPCPSCASQPGKIQAQLRRLLLSTPPLSKGLLRAFPRIRVSREGASGHSTSVNTVRLSDVVTLPPGQRVAIQLPLTHDPAGAFGVAPNVVIRQDDLDARGLKVTLLGVLVEGPW